jgi:hypothetical protein
MGFTFVESELIMGAVWMGVTLRLCVPLPEGHLVYVPVDWSGSKSMKQRA